MTGVTAFIYHEDYLKYFFGPTHPFKPIREKYTLDLLKELGVFDEKAKYYEPKPASEDDLMLVHTKKYVDFVKKMSERGSGYLDYGDTPAAKGIYEGSCSVVGGSLCAADLIMKGKVSHAFNPGGGLHHAKESSAAGFCVFNDIAIALEKMKKEGKIERGMVVDCDLHQGNGTSFILSRKDYGFTFSIHQMDNYPAEKSSSSVDVGLWSGDGDEKYLSSLRDHFPRLYQEFKPDLVIYLAGADPYEDDQLGNLNLTIEGLAERDRIVIEEARKLQLPVAVLFAGGYARKVEDTVSIHLNTIKVAQRVQRRYF